MARRLDKDMPVQPSQEGARLEPAQEQSREERHSRRRDRSGEKALWAALWFPLYFLWLEVICRIGLLGKFVDRGLGYTLLFSMAGGLLLAAFVTFGPPRYRRIFTIAVSALAAFWASAQSVYYTIFSTFLTLYSVGNGGDALQFWRDILNAMGKIWYLLILLWAPFVAMVASGSKRMKTLRWKKQHVAILLAAAAGLQLFATALVVTNRRGGMSPSYLYQYSFVPEKTAEEFGLFTTLRLDARQLFFGVKEMPEEPLPTLPATPTPIPTPDGTEGPTDEPTPTPVAYGPNTMDIDFAALAENVPSDTLKSMHQWFGSREATLQNEYTGAWKGKNLIFIVAEGFSRYAITAETTPTLYKLAHEGFVCDEFYNPLWWVSTSDGEYVADTSMIPKSGVWSFYRSSENWLKFCLGNQLRGEGYATRAYHNHTYTYYKRHLSHPNMGYDYKGVGNGLEVKKTWPESDVEMMEKTIPEYINDEHFHTYYMTVSGHMLYTFMGNYMSAKHKDEVGHEDFCEEARAYLACQMELDKAIEYLIEELRAAGKLENTAIVLTGDHYPYGMEKAAIDQLVGHQVEENFETYLSTLILWSGDMEGKEPVHIAKPVCSLDILPTVSNLMGLEYDSRLLMGHDALSTYPGLAVLSNRSFVTDLGYYNSKTDTFTLREGAAEPDEEYVSRTFKEVARMFTNSTRVLEQDYYRVLFPND